jgi:hypothetical protein
MSASGNGGALRSLDSTASNWAFETLGIGSTVPFYSKRGAGGTTMMQSGSMSGDDYDSPLDPGIREMVVALRTAGIETFESCEGGPGHSYAEPTVRFHGNHAEGFKALSVAMQAGLRVETLRRVWPVLDNEPTGPWWELTFTLTGR